MNNHERELLRMVSLYKSGDNKLLIEIIAKKRHIDTMQNVDGDTLNEALSFFASFVHRNSLKHAMGVYLAMSPSCH